MAVIFAGRGPRIDGKEFFRQARLVQLSRYSCLYWLLPM